MKEGCRGIKRCDGGSEGWRGTRGCSLGGVSVLKI